MKFGSYPVAQTQGMILAHSIMVGTRRIRKGTRLAATDISLLETAGIEQITVAQLAKDDVHEDAAALALATALVGQNKGLRISAPFTGRVNIYAENNGLLRLDCTAITAVNDVDPSITVATLVDYARVKKRALLATIKIIPFATSQKHLKAAQTCAQAALSFAPFNQTEATLILTQMPGSKIGLQEKGISSVTVRLDGMGCALETVAVTSHETAELATALKAAKSDLVLILTASATSDENDVGPAALLRAGGQLTRFGMPVDPGNLLFLGQLGDKTVVGLPGCVRSPALNGADWVLERLACGLPVTHSDISKMGVGGLLKEIPSRTQSRGGVTNAASRPRIEVLLLAAGASSRMKGVDKLIEEIGGVPLLRHVAHQLIKSQADNITVVIPPDHSQRIATLTGLDVRCVEALDWQSGMAASIRTGLGAVSPKTDAVIIALADMPEITATHINKLIAAFDPVENREIVRLIAKDGTPGHPVLFGRRFFESLANLSGDRGGKEIIRQATEFTVDIQTHDQAVLVDLDTPEDWINWRNKL